MVNVNHLKKDRAATQDAMEALLGKAETENRALTGEEVKDFDTQEVRFKELTETIERAERAIGRAATSAKPPQGRVGEAPEGFQSFGEFLQAVASTAMPGRSIDPRLIEERATGANEAIASEGGFLVTTDLATELIQIAHQTSQVVSKCRRIPISGTANGVKLNAIAESSRVDGSRWGGVQAYWIAEAATKGTGTKPAFRQIELNLKKLIGLFYATDELLQDAAALETVARQAFAEEFAFRLDDAVINGLGAGVPLGYLAAPCLISVAKDTGQAAKTVTPLNIVNMYSRMYAGGIQNAVWLINPDVFPQLYTMTLTAGASGFPVYLPPGQLSGVPYSTLLGRPVIPIEQCQTLGTKGDIAFVDMSQMLVADKGGVQSASSIHVKFIYDETVFRFVYRFDSQPAWVSALTPYKGTATVGPFVVLDARA